MIISLLLALIAAGFASYALNRWLVIPRLQKRAIIDIPVERSSHLEPVVRGGGIGWFLGGLLGAAAGILALFASGTAISLPQVLLVAAAGLALGLIGLADDLGTISPLMRLVLQFAAGLSLTVSMIGQMHLGAAAVIAVALSTVLVINAVNFMDGLNTLITAWAIFAGLWMSFFALLAGRPAIAVMSLALAGAAGGFLPLNRHPAKAFLGDIGSYAIGALTLSLFWVLWASGISFLILLAPFVIPLADVLLTLLRRLYGQERIFEAHKKHAYQRLHQAGLTHERVSAVHLGSAIVCSAIAAVGVYVWNSNAFILGGWLIAVTVYMLLPRMFGSTQS